MKIYGEWTDYEDGDKEKAKQRLKELLHTLIDELCEKDDFWIDCERDKTGKNILRQSNTIAWKIAIPHMEQKD